MGEITQLWELGKFCYSSGKYSEAMDICVLIRNLIDTKRINKEIKLKKEG